MRVPVQTAVWLVRIEGAFAIDVGDHVSVLGLYLPPVLREEPSLACPPQTTIRDPVHTVVWPDRPDGASDVEVGVQMSAAGS